MMTAAAEPSSPGAGSAGQQLAGTVRATGSSRAP